MSLALRVTAWSMAVACQAALAQGGFPEPPVLDLSAPLGSMGNPVRASMPAGQREYLMRLRCPEGDEPSFKRLGSMGQGPYGRIIDSYEVECKSGSKARVVMDMYHRGHREMAPVPGFAVLPDLPARVAIGCPPVVPGAPPGDYIFRPLEVERPTYVERAATQLKREGVKGRAYVKMVVGPDGRAVVSTIDVTHAAGDGVREAALEVVRDMRLTPAEHRPGCAVHQHVEFPLDFD